VVLVVGFTVLMAVLEVAVPYRTYSRVLRWLCLSLLAYFVVLFVVDVPWGEVARATFVPQFDLTRTQIAAAGPRIGRRPARRLPAEGSLAGVATLPTMPPPVAAIHKGAGDLHPDQAFAYVGVEER
jgi:hypothetical protein